MEEEKEKISDKPLLIYFDDDGEVRKVYSYYKLKDGIITFTTHQNKITLPISRLIKIKEPKDEKSNL